MSLFLDEKSKKPICSVAIRFMLNGYKMGSSSMVCCVLAKFSLLAILRAAGRPVPEKLRCFLVKERTLHAYDYGVG